jgi:cyclase
MHQLSSDVYVETSYAGGNVGCVSTEEGLVLIDTPARPRDAQAWRVRVTQLTKREVRYVIHTNCRPQDMMGNYIFVPATAVAHQTVWDQVGRWSNSQRQRLLESLKEAHPEAFGGGNEVKLVGPRLTFTERMTICCGEKTLRLMHLGGHSPAAIGVYLPDLEMFFSGGVVVSGRHPDMREAHTAQWLQALTEIRRLRIKVLVPGRGPLCTKEDTQRLSAYIRLTRRRVRSRMRDGRGWKEALDGIDLGELLTYFPVDAVGRPAVEKQICAGLRRVHDELRVT